MPRILLVVSAVLLTACPEYPKCSDSAKDCPPSHVCDSTHTCVARPDAGSAPSSSSRSPSSSSAGSSSGAMTSSSVGSSGSAGSSSSAIADAGVDDAGPCNGGCGPCGMCVNNSCVATEDAACPAQCGEFLAGVHTNDDSAQCLRMSNGMMPGRCNAERICVPDLARCAMENGIEPASLDCEGGCASTCDPGCVNGESMCQFGVTLKAGMANDVCLTSVETPFCGGTGCLASDGGFTRIAWACNAMGRCEGTPVPGPCDRSRCVEDGDCDTGNCIVETGVCGPARDAGPVDVPDAAFIVPCGAMDDTPCTRDCAEFIYALENNDVTRCTRMRTAPLTGVCRAGVCEPRDGGLEACRDLGGGDVIAQCSGECAQQAPSQKCVPLQLASSVTGLGDVCVTSASTESCSGNACASGALRARQCNAMGRCELFGPTTPCASGTCANAFACERECQTECPMDDCMRITLDGGATMCVPL